MIIKNLENWYTSKRVTEITTIVGNTGYGKSYAGGVIEEKYMEKEWPLSVIDKMGIHYVLRNKYNKCVIIGGDHGDFSTDQIDLVMPIIMEKDYSYILDLSEFDEFFAQEFVADFFDYLFQWHKEHQKPRHYLIEEADAFLGQTGTLKECKTVLTRCITKGRMNGFGFTLISQRFRMLDKTPLGQTKNYIIFNMKLPIDLNTLKMLVGDDISFKVRRLKQGQCIIMTDEGHSSYSVGVRKCPTVADTPEIGVVLKKVEVLSLDEKINKELKGH